MYSTMRHDENPQNNGQLGVFKKTVTEVGLLLYS